MSFFKDIIAQGPEPLDDLVRDLMREIRPYVVPTSVLYPPYAILITAIMLMFDMYQLPRLRLCHSRGFTWLLQLHERRREHHLYRSSFPHYQEGLQTP
jgi:hypothetical protein